MREKYTREMTETGDELIDTNKLFRALKVAPTTAVLSVSKIGGVRFGKHFSLEPNDVVAVKTDGLRLEFIGYEVSPGGCFSGTSLQRKSITFEAIPFPGNVDPKSMVDEWASTARKLLRLPDMKSPIHRLPLLVLVNPKSGPGKSRHIWDTDGHRIICQEAGHSVDVVITERASHALELLTEHDDLLAHYKGIVIVSGDGLMYEVIQGIMKRRDWAKVIRHMPIGILPGGSGNGLAKSINAAAGLPHSPLASALTIARWKTSQLDIAAVDILGDEAESIRVYSFLSLEWAISADIDIGSEYLRFMGENRFTVEAIKRLLFLRKYNGRLEFLPAESTSQCLPKSAREIMKPVESYWDYHDEILDAPTPILTLLPPIDEPVPTSWVKVEDTFWNMWNCNVAWMSGGSQIAPDSHFGDGFIQLQYLRDRNMNKWKLLKWLLGLDSGSHVNYSFNETTPCQAYRFTPLPNPNGELKGTIALDGEVVPYSTLQMQVLARFLTIFAVSFEGEP